MPRQFFFHIPNESRLNLVAAIPAALAFILLLVVKLPFQDSATKIIALIAGILFAAACLFSKKFLPVMILPVVLYAVTDALILINRVQYSLGTELIALISLAAVAVFVLTILGIIKNKKFAALSLIAAAGATLALDIYHWILSTNFQAFLFSFFVNILFYAGMFIIIFALSGKALPKGAVSSKGVKRV